MAITRTPRALNMEARSVDISSESLRSATKEAIPWYVDDNPGPALSSFVKGLVTGSTSRLFDNIRYFSIYENRNLFDDPDDDSDGTSQPVSSMPLMTDNQVKIQVDTTAGKLVQANSRINMLTNQGDFTLWKKAMKCEAAIQGEWTRMNLYSKLRQVARDALITGDGYLKQEISDSGDCIDAYRVFPNEIFVDTLEAAFTPPKKMYQMRYVSRDSMIARYPGADEVLSRANAAQPPTFPWTLYGSGMIEVSEGWVLPSKGRPGRHVIGCQSGTILDEEWPYPFFPFAHFRAAESAVGYYGQGLVQYVEAAQQSLNQMLNIMEEGATLAIAPFWIVAQGSNINLKHFDNVPGHILETTGADPKWMTNAPFHQAAPVYCDLLRSIIRDQFGNNQMDTGGEPPINRIDSKRALREYQDMSSAHITLMLEAWSKDLFVDIARQTLMLGMAIAKKKGSYPVLVQSTYKKIMSMDMKELDISDDAYMLTPAPANLLSQTPAGKTQDLTEMMQAGLITQKQAQRMMLGPQDVNAMMGEIGATEEDLDDLIEGFTEKRYRSPSSLQDLSRGIVRVSDERLLHAVRGAPDDVLVLFDRWLAAAEDVLQRMQQQPAPPSPPEGMTDGPPGAAGPAVPPGAAPPGGAIPIAGAPPALPPAVPTVGGSGSPGGPPPG